MKLTDEELDHRLRAILQAGFTGDRDAVIEAMRPLFTEGDAGDGYLIVCSLIDVVRSTMPPACCPEHGPDSDCGFVSVGLVPADADGRIDEAQLVAEGGPHISPEMEQEYPALVAFLRMLAAEMNGDEDMSVALWHAVVNNRQGGMVILHGTALVVAALRDYGQQ